MSKFKELSVSGDGNMIGDNNTQNNNSQRNKTINHYYNKPKSSSDDSEIFIFIIFIALGFGALIWWFFNNVEKIYDLLSMAILTSPVLAILAVIILLFSGSSHRHYVFRCLATLFISVGLFGLATLARDYLPQEIIEYSHQVKFMDFWKGLSDNEERLVIVNFFVAIGITLSTLIAHLISLRQFSYAMASPERVGFWYRLYTFSDLFSLKIAGTIIVLVSGVTWSVIRGYIFI